VTVEPPHRSAQGASPRQEPIDPDLLALVARAAGLEAVALVVESDGERRPHATWPAPGTPGAPDPAALIDAPDAVRAAGAVGEGVVAILAGRPAAGEHPRHAERVVSPMARLIASDLALDAARTRAEEARARTGRLVEAGLALASEPRLDHLLSRIVEAARDVLGARYAALGVLDATGTELAEFVTAGLTDEERLAIGDLPRGRGLLGVLIRDARPLRLERMADDPRRVGFPPNHPPMTSFLGVPIALRGEVFGNLYLTDKAGGPFTADDEAVALTLASQAAVAVDNVRRWERERRRVDELESVGEVARAALGVLDIDALLPLVARRARRLTGADTVGVAVVEDGALMFRHAHGVDALGLEGDEAPADLDALEERLRGTLGAPAVEVCALEVAGQLVGALVAVGWTHFDDGARRLLATFSSQVAIALANARAVAAERELMREVMRREAALAAERAEAEGLRRAVQAQEAERARVARELHDEAGQALTALAVHLRALESEVPEGPLRARIAGLRQSVGAATANVRELAVRLRPAALDEQGLAEAIEEQAARLRQTGIAVDVDLRGIDPGLPDDVQTVLFRVVQEALTNTARHSGARAASVVATARGGRLRLVVEDDGEGFDPATPSSRLGLVGIHERVGLIGGRLRIESSPGGGTAVVVDLELSR
jgi:signal transduction histidine kinase